MNARTKTVVAHEEELDIGQDKSITLNSGKTIQEITAELNEIQVVGMHGFQNLADELEFMNELVAVCVHPTSEKGAEQVIEVFNDGIPQRFIRGKWQTVRRKYVEVLARAKPFGITTPETSDSDGGRTTRIDTHTGLRYPFDFRDTNPRGAGWLQGILAEA